MTMPKKPPTRQQLAEEVSKLRAQCEQVRVMARELGSRTSQLYRMLDAIRPDESKRI